jgi:uncharacterized membrane protein/ribosomal protein L40E
MTFESSKTLAAIGSILQFIPIIGLILIIMGNKELSEHYKDESIYQNTLMGGIFSTIGTIFLYVIFTFVLPLLTLGTLAAIIAIAALMVCLIVAFVFMLLAAMNFRKVFNTLADRSGEKLFLTAGTLVWIGAILTIILVGFVLMFIGFILAGVAFFALKSPPNAPAYGYTPPTQAPPTASASNIKSNFCPNCGAPIAPEATFCSTCGKQI